MGSGISVVDVAFSANELGDYPSDFREDPPHYVTSTNLLFQKRKRLLLTGAPVASGGTSPLRASTKRCHVPPPLTSSLFLSHTACRFPSQRLLQAGATSICHTFDNDLRFTPLRNTPSAVRRTTESIHAYIDCQMRGSRCGLLRSNGVVISRLETRDRRSGVPDTLFQAALVRAPGRSGEVISVKGINGAKSKVTAICKSGGEDSIL